LVLNSAGYPLATLPHTGNDDPPLGQPGRGRGKVDGAPTPD